MEKLTCYTSVSYLMSINDLRHLSHLMTAQMSGHILSSCMVFHQCECEQHILSWLLKCLVTFWAAVWFFTSVSYFMHISSWLLKCLVTFWAAVWFLTSVSYFLHISSWLFTVSEKSLFSTNVSPLLINHTSAQNVTRHLSSQLEICRK